MNARERGKPYSYKVVVEIMNGDDVVAYRQTIRGAVKAPEPKKAIRRSLHDACSRLAQKR